MRRRLGGLLAAAVVLMLLAGKPAAAQEPERLSVWTYSLYKTITYELYANLVDIPLYNWFVPGQAAAATALFTVVNVGTAAGAYYVHEVLWNLYGPPMEESPETAFDVGLEKVIVYRVVSTARNLVLLYVFTGSVSVSIGFALVSNVVDATLYAANEYVWYAYGPPVESLYVPPARPDEPLQRTQAIDLQPVSAVATDAANFVRKGAVSLKTAARAAADGIAGAWLSLR
jgi:uncharacterized membrane protein